MHRLIRIVSFVIILLGVVHVYFAFPVQMGEGTLWFIGAGMAIIFAGLLNMVALHRGGSRFTQGVAAAVNATTCGLFCFAIPILGEPQVYVGVTIFLITTIAFVVVLLRSKLSPP
ncbi:MAG: hypothetical protein EOP49_00665 [Sphingobacteriales bacterium]|nr:MAG: hypothetical protein EOP49_00665 [Sphingobacteriales bacterium]